MPEFTRTDRALLIRVGSHLTASAATLEEGHGLDWGKDDIARAAKKLRDRLRRDETDLAALRRRIEAQTLPEVPPASG